MTFSSYPAPFGAPRIAVALRPVSSHSSDTPNRRARHLITAKIGKGRSQSGPFIAHQVPKLKPTLGPLP